VIRCWSVSSGSQLVKCRGRYTRRPAQVWWLRRSREYC